MIFTKCKHPRPDLRKEVRIRIESGNASSLLLVVPTNRKSRYLKREIISASPGGAVSGLNIETLGTFAQNLLSASGATTGRILSDAASAVLLKQSLTANNLKYFSGYKNDFPQGTLDRIKNVISEYKRYGVTPEMIRKESSKLEGAEKLKALDISSVFESYNILCSKTGVKEMGDIYAELNSLPDLLFSQTFKSCYPSADLMLMDGFDEFTDPELEIINSAADLQYPELYIEMDYYGLNEHIFSHLEPCYKKLIGKGFHPADDKTAATTDDFKGAIRKQLFFPASKKISGYDLNVIEAPSREQEVEFIAKEIKDLLISGNVKPGQICAAFNLINEYSPLIRDIFNVYGIPFNLTDRKALALSAPVVAVINFLEIIENDYYYRNIFRALSSGYIRLNDINISNLYAASADLNIISGYANWVSSLNNAIIMASDENNGTSAGKKTLYRKALDDINSLNEFLQPFNNKLTVKEFRVLLIRTISSLNIHSEILNNRNEYIEENIKGLTEFINTLDELFELLDKEEGKEKLPLKYFIANIKTAVSGTRFNIKEKPGFGVQVTNLNEIRGLKFDYLFIGGMIDGDLPTRYKPEIFNSGTFVKNERKHQTEERYHFYQSLCCWNQKLYLSYPLNSDKKEFVKSNFLKAFEGLFDTTVKKESDYTSRVYSREELLNLTGRGVISPETAAGYKIDTGQISESISINETRTGSLSTSSEYTGHIYEVLNAASREALAALCRKEFSVSQLELYAGCPFRYFVQRVLSLNTLEEPAEEIEARELGSLLHSILYKFYTELNKKKIVLKDADDKCFKTAVDLIFSVAGQELTSAVFSPLSFYEKEKILGINGNKKESILYRFLELERNTTDNFAPSYFEISFGNFPGEKSEKGEKVNNFMAGSVKVRGKIDRIDIDHQDETFKVVDYKTGSSKPSKKI